MVSVRAERATPSVERKTEKPQSNKKIIQHFCPVQHLNDQSNSFCTRVMGADAMTSVQLVTTRKRRVMFFYQQAIKLLETVNQIYSQTSSLWLRESTSFKMGLFGRTSEKPPKDLVSVFYRKLSNMSQLAKTNPAFPMNVISHGELLAQLPFRHASCFWRQPIRLASGRCFDNVNLKMGKSDRLNKSDIYTFQCLYAVNRVSLPCQSALLTVEAHKLMFVDTNLKWLNWEVHSFKQLLLQFNLCSIFRYHYDSAWQRSILKLLSHDTSQLPSITNPLIFQ